MIDWVVQGLIVILLGLSVYRVPELGILIPLGLYPRRDRSEGIDVVPELIASGICSGLATALTLLAEEEVWWGDADVVARVGFGGLLLAWGILFSVGAVPWLENAEARRSSDLSLGETLMALVFIGGLLWGGWALLAPLVGNETLLVVCGVSISVLTGIGWLTSRMKD